MVHLYATTSLGMFLATYARTMPQFALLAKWAWRDPLILQSAVQLAVGKLSR